MIVVAIVGILAAIVPQYNEYQLSLDQRVWYLSAL